MNGFIRLVNCIDLLREKSNHFFYGKIYPVIFSLSVLLLWIFNVPFVGFGLGVAICFFLFISGKDLTPAFPVIFTLAMTFRDTNVFSSSPVGFILIGIFFLGLAINLIRFPIKKPKVDKVLLSILLLGIAMLLGGLFSPYLNDYLLGLPHFAIAILSAGCVYFLISNRTCPEKKVDIKRYFCFTFIVATNLACAQLIYGTILSKLEGLIYFPFNMQGSWANTIHLANLMIIALPLCFYLILDAKHTLPLIVQIVFLYVCLFLTKSDGATAIALCFFPVLIIFTFSKVSNKNFFSVVFSLSLIIALCFLAVCFFLLFMPNQTLEFIITASNDSGRIKIYALALELFSKFPIFGVGLGHSIAFLNTTDNLYNGFFHSTFFHSIASMGIIGLFAYIILYISRIKLLAKNNTTFGLFAMISFFMFAIYGMVDNSEVNIIVVYMNALFAVASVVNNEKQKKPLPLCYDRRALY